MENNIVFSLPSNLISSLVLCEQINIFRQVDGKSELGHNDLLKVIRDEFEEEISLGKISQREYLNSRGQKYPMYELTTSQAKQVLVRESKTVRKAVIAYIEKLEKSLSLPDFTDPAAAAIAWANEYRAKQQLAQQNENLQIALDSHLDWLTILSVAKLNNVSEKVFDWRKLTERSRIMGYEIKKTTCPRFGYRNNYHLNVFRAEYPQYSLTRDKQLL